MINIEINKHKLGFYLAVKFHGTSVTESLFQSHVAACEYALKFVHDYYGVLRVKRTERLSKAVSGKRNRKAKVV